MSERRCENYCSTWNINNLMQTGYHQPGYTGYHKLANTNQYTCYLLCVPALHSTCVLAVEYTVFCCVRTGYIILPLHHCLFFSLFLYLKIKCLSGNEIPLLNKFPQVVRYSVLFSVSSIQHPVVSEASA
ncbi:hypothetical protein GOODEAATRI_012049 [Goodea atripinnis]|uniref:Uncharacterized protein n=1 Tax=Goodea atripinnis TaxID=208336 RepID=A0ABV0MSS6_9TELE